MRYSCLAPGKRLRPAFCLACCIAAGGAIEDAFDAACAVEMVHCFSLIHDDLPAIDNDDLRRGMPTCHIKFGEAVAILAGDALFALAFDTLSRVKADPARVVAAIGVLTAASGSSGLVGGETIDILAEGKPITADLLEAIHAKKTGALIAASCEIGAIFGGGDQKAIAAMREFGQRIGLAFQIADDVLNEVGSAHLLGKAVGSDRERQKATFPALYGIEASRERARRETELALGALNLTRGSGFLADLSSFSVDRLS